MTTTTAPLIAPEIGGVPAQSVGPRLAAAMLGKSKRSIHRWIAAGQLPAVKLPSGSVLIRVADLEKLGAPAGSTAA